MAMMMILEGWNDGSLGPVIPALQDYYNVSYSSPRQSDHLSLAGRLSAQLVLLAIRDLY